MNGSPVSRKYDPSAKNQAEITSLNHKMDQFRELLKKRDEQIKSQMSELKELRDHKNVIIARLNVISGITSIGIDKTNQQSGG
jgi:chromosome segregation ATPase